MVRTIVTPEDTHIEIEVPKEFIGKRIEVVLTEAAQEEFENLLVHSKPKARYAFNAFRADLTNFKFDRDEANER